MHQTSNFVFWMVSFTEDFLHPANHNPNKNGESLPPHPGCNGHHQDDMTHFLGSGIPNLHLPSWHPGDRSKVWVGVPEPKDVSCRPGGEDCILDFTLLFFSDRKVHPRLLRRYDHLVQGHHVSRQWCWSWHGCNIPSDFLLGEVEEDEHFLIKKYPKCQVDVAFFPKYTRLFLCLGVVK